MLAVGAGVPEGKVGERLVSQPPPNTLSCTPLSQTHGHVVRTDTMRKEAAGLIQRRCGIKGNLFREHVSRERAENRYCGMKVKKKFFPVWTSGRGTGGQFDEWPSDSESP